VQHFEIRAGVRIHSRFSIRFHSHDFTGTCEKLTSTKPCSCWPTSRMGKGPVGFVMNLSPTHSLGQSSLVGACREQDADVKMESQSAERFWKQMHQNDSELVRPKQELIVIELLMLYIFLNKDAGTQSTRWGKRRGRGQAFSICVSLSTSTRLWGRWL